MKPLILATGLFAAIACSGLRAQSINMRANIPFDFRVGTSVLPSGDYVIQNRTDGVLMVQAVSGKAAVLTFTTGGDHPASTGQGTLQFTRYGDDYYLSKVWTSDSDVERTLPKSKREAELAKRIGALDTATVALRKQ